MKSIIEAPTYLGFVVSGKLFDVSFSLLCLWDESSGVYLRQGWEALMDRFHPVSSMG